MSFKECFLFGRLLLILVNKLLHKYKNDFKIILIEMLLKLKNPLLVLKIEGI